MAIVKKEYAISLDIKKSVSNREFEVVEGDTGNVLQITLTDDGEAVPLSDCLVQAVFSKSDGSVAVEHNLSWTDETGVVRPNGGVVLDGTMQNRFSIALYPQSFSPGMVECEIQVFSKDAPIRTAADLGDATLVTSAKFNFSCRRGITGEETVLSQPQWPLLVQAMETMGVLLSETSEAETQRRERDQAQRVWEPYDPDKAYVTGNKVSYLGSSYLCTAAASAGTGPWDAACWLLIAQAGEGDMNRTVYDPHGVGGDMFSHRARHRIGGGDALTPADIGAAPAPLQFFDVAVPLSLWQADSTYEDYGFCAALPLAGVTADMIPRVVFDVPQAVGGLFAPVCSCGAGTVQIYAMEIPEAAFTIPTIVCERAVN